MVQRSHQWLQSEGPTAQQHSERHQVTVSMVKLTMHALH